MNRAGMPRRASCLAMLAALVLIGAGDGPARALDNETVSLDCRFAVAQADAAYLPETLSVTYASWGSKAVVDDPLIARFVGEPLNVTIDTSSRAQLRLSWNLGLKVPGTRIVSSRYTLTILQPGREAVISVSVNHKAWVHTYRAAGKCKPA